MSAIKKLFVLVVSGSVLFLFFAFCSLWLASFQFVDELCKDKIYLKKINMVFDYLPFYNARMREVCVTKGVTKWMKLLPYYQSITLINMVAWMDEDLRGCLISKYTPFVGRHGEQLIGLDAASMHWFERRLDELTDEEIWFIKSKIAGRRGPKS